MSSSTSKTVFSTKLAKLAENLPTEPTVTKPVLNQPAKTIPSEEINAEKTVRIPKSIQSQDSDKPASEVEKSDPIVMEVNDSDEERFSRSAERFERERSAEESAREDVRDLIEQRKKRGPPKEKPSFISKGRRNGGNSHKKNHNVSNGNVSYRKFKDSPSKQIRGLELKLREKEKMLEKAKSIIKSLAATNAQLQQQVQLQNMPAFGQYGQTFYQAPMQQQQPLFFMQAMPQMLHQQTAQQGSLTNISMTLQNDTQIEASRRC